MLGLFASPLWLIRWAFVAKSATERINSGATAKWINANFNDEQSDSYLNEAWADWICSFYGKRLDETDVPLRLSRGV